MTLSRIRVHTLAATRFLTGKPLENTPETDESNPTPLIMGLKLITFETSPEVYLISLPRAAGKKVLTKLVIHSSNKII